MKKSILLLASIAVLASSLPVATNAATQVYDLNTQWSDTDNPNGPWSYRQGNNLLQSGSANTGCAGGCPPIPAWVGFSSQIYKFDGGDVVVQPAANILWTAPITGTIDISGAVWDDPFCGGGSYFWALSHNGNSLSGGQLTCGEYFIESPFYFSLGSGGSSVLQNIPVAAGDQVVLEIGNGSFTALGVNFTITLTPDAVDPIAAVQDLEATVIDMNLQNGIENSLDSKLDAVLNALSDVNSNNDGAACNSLQAFINSVEAQRGNKITSAQADQLIASAQQIQALLNCGN